MGKRIEAVLHTVRYVAEDLRRGSDLSSKSVLVYPPQQDAKVAIPQHLDRKRARKELQEAGFWEAIEETANAIPTERNAAVDYGYIVNGDNQILPVGVIFWAPQISPDGKVTSKAVRVVKEKWGSAKVEYVFGDSGESANVFWKKLEVNTAAVGSWSLRAKLDLAKSCVSGRIRDSRIHKNGELIGNPGVGDIN